jgi:hypothetical protein
MIVAGKQIVVGHTSGTNDYEEYARDTPVMLQKATKDGVTNTNWRCSTSSPP